MNNRKGGKTPLLPVRTLLIGLLVCANIAMAGILLRGQNSATDAQETTIGNCKEAPAKLTGVPLSLERPGVTQEVAGQWYYKVSGNTPMELNDSIKQCSPIKDAYTANTEYVLNWKVDYKQLGGGQCATGNVAVGIRVRHTYPLWKATDGTPASTGDTWNSFMDNLAMHEDGHTKLDQQYAQELFSDLQAITNYACETIEQHAKSIAATRTKALANANKTYDSTTGHGDSQGAKLLDN
jgi:predicted secreted Zn-dependent protease